MRAVLILLVFCCLFTVLFELLPILFLRNKRTWLKASLLCNIITNPILNTVLLLLFSVIGNGAQNLAPVLEVLVVLFEAFVYQKMTGATFRKCLIVSACANALSYLIGSAVLGILFLQYIW